MSPDNPDDPEMPKPEEPDFGQPDAAPASDTPELDAAAPPETPEEALWRVEPEAEIPDLREEAVVPDLRPEDRPDLFGEPEIPAPQDAHVPPREKRYVAAPEDPYIPLPGERARYSSGRHARDAQRNIDLDLGRIKRRKRYGFFLTTLSVMFIAFFLAPVTWVGIYRVIDAPATFLMMQRAAEGQTIRHQPIAITRMSPNIVRAVIAAEDAQFCEHHGFDVEAIQNAMEANADGGRLRGGSTISQQTAKNLFLWPQRSWLRKGFETYFTALIEFMWPKQRIMEHYLNVAEWGDGIFGVQAAAQARFGVDAEDLTPLQAARLAAVLPSPNRYRADHPGVYVRRQSARIVERARVVRNEHMAGCVLALDRPGA